MSEAERSDLSWLAHAVPADLLRLVEYSQPGGWEAAILLRRTSWFWQRWPLEHSLVVIDQARRIHQASFIIRPPPHWPVDPSCQSETFDRKTVYKLGVAPDVAMAVLNEVIGGMRVYGTSSMLSYELQHKFEQAAGARATWSMASVFDGAGANIRVPLSECGYAEFGTMLPLGGTLAERAFGWAEAYVSSRQAFELFQAARIGSQLPIAG